MMNVLQWEVEADNILKAQSKSIKGLVYRLYLSRRNTFAIVISNHLPTLLMNLINQATNYISTPDKYELIVTVNVTCMMVLATIYLSVSSSLPSTSGLKPIEWYLLSSLLYPFLVISVNILIQVCLSASSIKTDTFYFKRSKAWDKRKTSCGKVKKMKQSPVGPVSWGKNNIAQSRSSSVTLALERIAFYFLPFIYVSFLLAYVIVSLCIS